MPKPKKNQISKSKKDIIRKAATESKNIPYQSSRQTIVKDMILVGFSIVIGFLFSINPLIAVIVLIAFSFIIYTAILEILNIPLFSIYNVKLKFSSNSTANKNWVKIYQDYTIYGIMHALLFNKKKWPKMTRNLIDLGDFSDTSQIVLSSSNYDIIQTVMDTLKNFKIFFKDTDEKSFSSIKTHFNLGDCWRAKEETSKVGHWYMKKSKISITGHGTKDTFDALCGKVTTIDNFEKIDDSKDFKVFVHTEQNIFASIVLSMTGSEIIIGIEYNETGGLSWKPSLLISTNIKLKRIIGDIKKYHNNASITSTFDTMDIEAVKFKTQQKECIKVRKVAGNSLYK